MKLSCSFQNRNVVCEQNRTGLEDRNVEQDDGFGFLVWGVTEVKGVAIGAEAADELGAWGRVDGSALGADGDFAVVADAHTGLLTPDVGPPGALGGGADDGAFFGEGLLVGGLRCLAQFAMDFVLVGVRDELREQLVGARDFKDAICRKQWDQAFLPVVVAAFDFAFGLGRGGVAEFDTVEVQGLAELGEGVGVVGIEEGVVVHIEGQRQAVALKDAREEIQVGQQAFGGVEARAGIQARGVVENFQEDLFVVTAGQEGVGRGVVLPERAGVAGLPAFDGLGRWFVAGVGSEFVFDGPTTDAGAVGFEVEPAEQFAGNGAVGAGRLGREEFGDQGGDLRGPVWVVISAGESGRPGLSVAVSVSLKVLAVEFIEAGTGQPEFIGGGASADLTGTITVEQMADERRGQTFDQLLFFIGPKITEGRWIYRIGA
jgi:hypothetical protein